jgi:hypothetical protein
MTPAEIPREQVRQHVGFAAEAGAEDRRAHQRCPSAAGQSQNERAQCRQPQNVGMRNSLIASTGSFNTNPASTPLKLLAPSMRKLFDSDRWPFTA